MAFLNRAIPFHQIRLFRAHQPDNDAANVICLIAGGSQTIPREIQRVYVITGTAWLTANGEDNVVNAGDSIALSSRYPMVISALRNSPLVYRME